MPRFFRFALLPIALLLTAANAPDAVIAQRGEVKITAGEIENLLDMMEPAARERLRTNSAALTEAIRERFLRDSLLAEAQAAKWDARADVAAKADDARIQVIVQSFLANQTQASLPEPTEQEIVNSYEASKSQLTVPKQYNIAQIALLIPPSASKETEEELRKTILDIRAQALKPKADFADLARKLSQDKPTAGRGGDLGWVREDVLIPAIRSAVMTMKDNTISEPIRGSDSWHIVRLSGNRPPGVMPLEQAREGLIQAIRQARAQAAARAYLAAMLQKEPIRLNEIELSRQFPPSAK